MAKLITTDLSNLSNETSAVSVINSNFAAVGAAIENTLSRDGTTPNAMSDILDMNSNAIINLPAPTLDHHAATKEYVDDSIDLIDGLTVYRQNSFDVSLADGGTGSSLIDPGADRLMFWDDSSSEVTWLELGTGLSISGTTLNGTATGYAPGGTDVALADGGTGASLADPGADRIMFWDDSAGQTTWLTPGTGLSISGTTLSVTPGRTRLTGPTTLYVRTDGSDSNDGSANTAGGAFLSLTAAYKYICRYIDMAGYPITLKLGNAGTYVGGFSSYGDFDSVEDSSFANSYVTTGGGGIIVEGDTSNINSYVIEGAFRSGAADGCFYLAHTTPSNVELKGVKLKARYPIFAACKQRLIMTECNMEFRTGGGYNYIANGFNLYWSYINANQTFVSGNPAYLFYGLDGGTRIEFYPYNPDLSGLTTGDFCYMDTFCRLDTYFAGTVDTFPGSAYTLNGYSHIQPFGSTIPATSAGTTDGKGYVI